MANYARFRILIILLIGIFLSLSSVFTRHAGARGQQAESLTRSSQKRRLGDVPAAARPENFNSYMSPSETIRMVISFELLHEDELHQLTADLYDPASPLYHKWLTPEEFGQRFGRTQEEFNNVAGWLEDQGMEVDRGQRRRLTARNG